MAEQLLSAEQWNTYCEGIFRNDCRITYGDSTRRWAESNGLVVGWARTHSVIYALLGFVLGVLGGFVIAAIHLYLWHDVKREASYLSTVGIWPILGLLAFSALAGLIVGVLLGRNKAFKRSFSLWLAGSEEIYRAAVNEGDIEIWHEPGRGDRLSAADGI